MSATQASIEALATEIATARQKNTIRGTLTTWKPEVLAGAVLSTLGIDVVEAVEKNQIAYAGAGKLIYATSTTLGELAASGMTTVVQALHTRPGFMNLLCATLEYQTQRRLASSIYSSSSGDEAFEFHIDEWDAFIIQIQGSKIFHFDHSLYPESVVLRTGDFLYMPQGVRHRASTPRASVHLSLNFLPVLGRLDSGSGIH